MAELLNKVVAFVGREDVTDLLARELDVESRDSIWVGGVLSATTVLANLAEWVTDPVGREWLAGHLPAIDSETLTDFAQLRDHENFHVLGDGLVDLLLRRRRDDVSTLIGSEVGIETEAADFLLAAVGWIVVACLPDGDAGRDEDDLSRAVAVLDEERADLFSQGWGQLIEATDGLRTDDEEEVASGTLFAGSHSPGALSPERTASASPDQGLRRFFRRHVILGALGALVIAVGSAAALLVVLDNEKGDTIASGDDSEAGNAGDDRSGGGIEPETEVEVAGAADAGTGIGATTEQAGDPTSSARDEAQEATAQIPDVAGYQLALDDPQGRSDATAVVGLWIDTMTGEVCYRFDVDGVEAPYASHIHLGPESADGGIVVDFGFALEDGSEACVANDAAVARGVVRDPTGHYVEVHNGFEFSVRSQLKVVQNGANPDELTIDPEAAHVVVRGGALILRGTVSDQTTMDTLVASFADVEAASIEVVNEVTIASGAPEPSDRILVEDTILFAFDSTEMTDRGITIVTDLADILRARPDWTASVVGHTDGVGPPFYNFTLSLQRAVVVRSALVAAGVAPEAASIQGLGPLSPIAANDTSAGRAENRRIEVRISAG